MWRLLHKYDVLILYLKIAFRFKLEHQGLEINYYSNRGPICFNNSLPITLLYFYIKQNRYFKYCPEDFISISCLPSNRSVFGNIDLFVLRNSDFICWVILYSIVYLSRMVISPLSEVKDHTNHFFLKDCHQVRTMINENHFPPNIFHRNKFPTCLLIAWIS